LALTLLGWLFWRPRTARFRPAMVSIATTGGAGMSAAVLILYAFQASQGTLYVGIAVLTALYMAGLTAGAFLGRQYLASKPRHAGVKADGLIIVVLVVTGPVLSLSGASPVIPAAWSLVAGAATGAAFPVFLGLAAESRGRDERASAAAVEIADHAGAGLGALVTGIIWLPVFGVTQTCLMLAAVKGVSLAGQIVSGRLSNSR
jgi:hypothetical protein